MNDSAPTGVKVLLIIAKADIPEFSAITENVLIIASFAESPAIIADAACQLPKPSGLKKGAAAFPRKARILQRQSEVI